MEIKTAREILENNHINEGFKLDDQCTYDISVDSMIEFAVMHVKAALEIAWKNAELETFYDPVAECPYESINRNSILNSYNLENIK